MKKKLENHSIGCDDCKESLKFKDYEKHIINCASKKIQCPTGCKFNAKVDILIKHIEEECKYIPSVCKKCDKRFTPTHVCK